MVSLFQVVFVLFLGSWSDRWGRRLPLLLSLCGLLGESAVYLCLFYMKSWPLETVLLSSIPYALSGGTHAMLMLCFSYLADTTKKG